MQPFDIACVIILLLIAVRAGLRGLVEEAAATASIVLGLLLAFLFFRNGGAFLRGRGVLVISVLPEVTAFAAIFLIVFIVIRVLAGILKDILNRIALQPVDHLLGVIFGLAEALAVIVIIIFIIDIQPLFDQNAVLDGSFFARFLFPNTEIVRRGLGGVRV